MEKSILKVFNLQEMGFSLIRWDITEGEIILKLKAESQASSPGYGYSSYWDRKAYNPGN